MKTKILLMMSVLILTCVGCGQETVDKLDSLINEADTAIDELGENIDTLGDEVTIDHKTFFDANVPGPTELFADYEYDIWSPSSIGSDFYGFTVSGVTKDDVASYVDGLNEDVFVHAFSQTDSYYHAASNANHDTESYYSIEVRYSEDNDELMVTCGYVDKDTAAEE